MLLIDLIYLYTNIFLFVNDFIPPCPMKIDVLQAEVAALKTLVLSTSPTSPTKEFQSGGKTPFKKGHARNKSTSSAMGGSHQDLTMMQPIVKDCKEVTYKDCSLFADNLSLLFCFTHNKCGIY